MSEKISVLLCTYKRANELAALLKDLAAQTRLPDELVVVDNDAEASASETVQAFASDAPFQVRYEVQPLKNISITRNRTVSLATGDWFAFIDDDERAPPQWIETLHNTARAHEAAGVLGPVICLVPQDAPRWIRRADHYGMARAATGTLVQPNHGWVNNALILGAAVRELPGPFDERFGTSGGEDGDMIARLLGLGHRLVWCDEAEVSERVEKSRQSLKWILMRAMRGGQNYATHWKRGIYGPLHWYSLPLFLLGSVAKMGVAVLGAIAVLPFGPYRSVRWLRRAAANVGKLSAFAGMQYEEYAAREEGQRNK